MGLAGFATAATGSFDAATDTQVRAFQTAQDLVVDGIVGAGSRRALGLPL